MDEKDKAPAAGRRVTLQRTTKETAIELTLQMERSDSIASADIAIESGLPFFDHILYSMAFHGRLGLHIRARGDLQVDPHHTVEDIGLVLGDALAHIQAADRALCRFAHAVVPMDDALASATVDLCNRPFLVYRAHYPQDYAGDFQLALLREFFRALVGRARCNLHLHCLYGDNSHHISEALFKALGRALHDAFRPNPGLPSTKGVL